MYAAFSHVALTASRRWSFFPLFHRWARIVPPLFVPGYLSTDAESDSDATAPSTVRETAGPANRTDHVKRSRGQDQIMLACLLQ